MPFLSTDKFGAGPLYNFSSTDPNAYLTQGTTYFQTSASGWAIQQDVFDSTFICAGEIGSNGIGIRGSTNDGSRIDVTPTGYISTDDDAILVFATGEFVITNAGQIVSNSDAIRLGTVLGSSLDIINSGTIRAASGYAIYGGGEDDIVWNTGTITGNISLGNGSDFFDTHLGNFSGTVFGGAGGDFYMIAGTERISESANGGYDFVESFGIMSSPRR